MGAIKNYFSVLKFFNDNERCRIHLQSNISFQQSSALDPREIIPLASPNKRVIFALRSGDDMAECKQEKQGRFSASFFLGRSLPKAIYHFQFELLCGLFSKGLF
jgi:hypothetical protein